MSNLKKRLDYSLTPASWLSLSVIFFSLCFGWLLPINYGQENGPEENLQAVVLGIAALVAISALFQAHFPPSRRKLFALSSVGLLLALARELGWGRVFYMDSTGRIPPLKELWFGSYVYPGIVLVVIITLTYFFSQGLHKESVAWLKQAKIPVVDVIIILSAIVIADVIEHHSAGIFGDKTEVYEELAELVSYMGVLSFMANIVFSKRFRTDKTPKIGLKG